MLKILIADDHLVIRKGLKQILLEEFPSAEIEEARDAEDVFNLLIKKEFDLIICDLSMPGKSGLDVVHQVKQDLPKLPVLILSMQPEEQYAVRALKAGAAGYLNKSVASEELIKAVQRVLQGRRYISPSIAEQLAEELEHEPGKQAHELLSDREFHVFLLLAEGKPVSLIAEVLSLSITTVSTYRSRVMTKMDMKSNADLTRYALEKNLI
jgi:DNA-binding NarL/FixJ family response regulator